MLSLPSDSNSLCKLENLNLENIRKLDQNLLKHFQNKFITQASLNRCLVSFQANKNKPFYRWYKYKEAFSASLVEYLFQTYHINQGKILDPFAGSGTALFAASELGINADGIELLPIGQKIIQTRQTLISEFDNNDFKRLEDWLKLQPWQSHSQTIVLQELRITQNAYPQKTKDFIERYLSSCDQEKLKIRNTLRFALLCVLEQISYTRKDGQYLRWDYRSGRGQGKKTFDKGEILDFNTAIVQKITELLNDLAPSTQQLDMFSAPKQPGKIHLYAGSCLDILPHLPSHEYEAMITSPPYCNRYDYTRTYALELALMGISETEIAKLRQQMLSCTVENRPKDLLAINSDWEKALNIADQQALLQAILIHLNHQKEKKELNNNGIPRMVKGYFYEMACMIQESFRVLKPGAFLFMVNDNVRYAGASISVDMILSDFAEKIGFIVEDILILPTHKGNSSQQMGNHGRDPLRKCVYVWKKP